MMGIVVPEICWAYKKYNKIISGIKLVCILQLAVCTVVILLITVLSRLESSGIEKIHFRHNLDDFFFFSGVNWPIHNLCQA